MSDDKITLATPKFWLPLWFVNWMWPNLDSRTQLTGEARRAWTLIPHVAFCMFGVIEVEFGPVEFGAVAYKRGEPR